MRAVEDHNYLALRRERPPLWIGARHVGAQHGALRVQQERQMGHLDLALVCRHQRGEIVGTNQPLKAGAIVLGKMLGNVNHVRASSCSRASSSARRPGVPTSAHRPR
jgi:hypothetical protein